MDASNFDKLVNAVTKNILEKTGVDISTESSGNSAILVIIPNAIFGFKEYLAYIKGKYKKNKIYYSSYESVLDALEINKELHIPLDTKNGEFVKAIDAFDKVIVVGPKIEILKALSDSDDTDDIHHIILGRAMANKAIIILMNINGNIMSKVSGIIVCVQKLGIEVTNIQQGENDLILNDDLILEKDVLSLKDSGLKKIRLRSTQRLTPLAKDKLREYKISIEYDEEDQS